MNLEVASKINEELRTALDPKELESFARQIACGMVNSDKLLMFFMYKNNKTRLVQVILTFFDIGYTYLPLRHNIILNMIITIAKTDFNVHACMQYILAYA